MIQTDHQESATTAADGDNRAIPPQSTTDDNERSHACISGEDPVPETDMSRS